MAVLSISKAQKLTSPNPFGLVCSCDGKGKTNLMALSWWTYCSNNPGTVAICLSKTGHSGSLIRARKQFALCIVDSSLAEAAFKCGTCSGRDVDKAKEFCIELAPASALSLEVVKKSRVVFECNVVNVVSVGDHDMFIGEVVAINGDEAAKALYAMQGYGKLSTVE